MNQSKIDKPVSNFESSKTLHPLEISCEESNLYAGSLRLLKLSRLWNWKVIIEFDKLHIDPKAAAPSSYILCRFVVQILKTRHSDSKPKLELFQQCQAKWSQSEFVRRCLWAKFDINSPFPAASQIRVSDFVSLINWKDKILSTKDSSSAIDILITPFLTNWLTLWRIDQFETLKLPSLWLDAFWNSCSTQKQGGEQIAPNEDIWITTGRLTSFNSCKFFGLEKNSQLFLVWYARNCNRKFKKCHWTSF